MTKQKEPRQTRETIREERKAHIETLARKLLLEYIENCQSYLSGLKLSEDYIIDMTHDVLLKTIDKAFNS
jgi:hypothetical protein